MKQIKLKNIGWIIENIPRVVQTAQSTIERGRCVKFIITLASEVFYFAAFECNKLTTDAVKTTFPEL